MAGEDGATKAVGPYLLQRTLGKGQTGLVKLGIHCHSSEKVAVKIINREKLSKSVLLKVEREIAIMKLINHPHVLGLYDVYENNTHLYLILEHVSGGELFDYLVKKGRLSEREAKRFFRQIVSAVDFCHKHQVCHRDLKPENLLLDEQRHIKVADFGMASLQVGGKMLETSCGSPHYACPEVIRGDQYDGRKADVWSCGVILYALLVGALPFDDDNLRVLLEKVKRGHFVIPPYLPQGAQQLLKGMVVVDPNKRLSLDDVMRHPWFKGTDEYTELEPVAPMSEAVQTVPLDSRTDIDPDVFKSMASLGCFKDRTALQRALLSPEHNEEKVVYFLLLGRKERQPSMEDETRAIGSRHERDPPRKRVDSTSSNLRVRSHSIGSAVGLDSFPSRQTRHNSLATPTYSPSMSGYCTYTTFTPPASRGHRKTSYATGDTGPNVSATLHLPITGSPQQPGSPWKRKLSQTVKTFMGSPRFHRRRLDGRPESPTATALSGNASTPTSDSPSPVMAKRSWFANLKSDKDKEEVVVVYRDKSFTELRSSLLQSFTVVNCEHEQVGENVFKLKYAKSRRQKGKRVFKKPVKFLIKVDPARTAGESGDNDPNDGKTFVVTFVQTNGPSRRFYRVCDKLQSAIVNPSAINPLNTEFVDYDNPSISSDDTLTRHTSSSPNGEGSERSEVATPHTNGAGDPSLTDDSTSDMSDAESVPGTE